MLPEVSTLGSASWILRGLPSSARQAATNMMRHNPLVRTIAASVPHGPLKTTTFIAGFRRRDLIAPLALKGPMTGAASEPGSRHGRSRRRRRDARQPRRAQGRRAWGLRAAEPQSYDDQRQGRQWLVPGMTPLRAIHRPNSTPSAPPRALRTNRRWGDCGWR